MTSADPAALVVVDTNVLLAATDRSRSAHAAALEFLDTDERRLALTPQIVREYLAVATRPTGANGLGLLTSGAVGNIDQLLEEMPLLPENVATTSRLTELVDRRGAIGKQVHDANIVAVALLHGASAIVTDNIRHFARFGDLIDIEPLAPPLA